MLNLPLVSALRGRPREALQRLAAFNTFATTVGLPPQAIQEAEFVSAMNLALDRPAAAVAHLDSILTLTPLKSLSPSDRDYLGVAEVYALAGRADKAARF